MAKTRRDLIMNLVREYTSESLADKSFSFERCNAFDIALDLKLDRSNVSRILNQLFNDLQLIKVEGRPTLYLSKDVIVGEYHFNNIPQIIPGKENLKNLFVYDASDASFYKKGMNIIGNGYEESLTPVISKITPAIFYYQNKPLLIALQGEKGSGKKYFCKKLFDLAVQNKRISKKSRSFTFDYRSINESFSTLWQQFLDRNISMVIMEIYTPFQESEIYRFWNDLNNLCSNENKPLPIMIFLIDKSVENFAYFSQLTPYTAKYPNVKERTTKEMIELVLTFLQEEAVNLNCRIKVTGNAIASFLSADYTYNLFQLRNEIVYSLSNNLYSSVITNHEPIVITHENISKNVIQNKSADNSLEDHIRITVTQLLPEIIDIYPDQPCETLENLLQTQLNASIVITAQLKNIIEKAKEDVLMTRTKLLDSSSIEMQSKVYQALTPLFTKTKLKNDRQILSKLYIQIQHMLDNTFAYQFQLEHLDYKETAYSQELSDNVISTVENKFNISLLKVYKSYIRNFIYYALKSISQNTIMTLIVCHGERLAENYAQHLNQILGSRCFFSFDYNLYYQTHDFHEFTDKIYKLIKYIDIGKGVLIVGDKPPLTTLDKSIISTLNIPSFSLYPVSLPLLYETSEVVSQKTMHLLALLSDVVNRKKKIKAFLNDKSLTSKNERQSSDIFQRFQATFPTINIAKSNEALYRVLLNICTECNLPLSNNIIIQFLFHGTCMLDRCVKKQKIRYNLLESFMMEHTELFHIMKTNLLKIRDFMTLSISQEEIAVLCDVILNYQMEINVQTERK